MTKNVTFFAMVSWMRNTAKDVKTEINNTLLVFASFRLIGRREGKDAMAQRIKTPV